MAEYHDYGNQKSTKSTFFCIFWSLHCHAVQTNGHIGHISVGPQKLIWPRAPRSLNPSLPGRQPNKPFFRSYVFGNRLKSASLEPLIGFLVYLQPKLCGIDIWKIATKADRVGSIPGRIISKTWSAVLAACPDACSALMGECKGRVHAWCCHWLATSAAFTAKLAVWSWAQISMGTT